MSDCVTMNLMLQFITHSRNKFVEAQAVIPELEQLNINLPEIQTLDPYKLVREKIVAARQHTQDAVIVEDTSLYIRGLNDLPGTLTYWFITTLGVEKMYELAIKTGNRQASAKTVVGYLAEGSSDPILFEGSIEGEIVAPSIESGYGWDTIFQPYGLNETYAAMGHELKTNFSMRTVAFQKLKKYLDYKNK